MKKGIDYTGVTIIFFSKVQNGEPHKFEELGWFRLDNLPEKLHSQFPFALEQYWDRL